MTKDDFVKIVTADQPDAPAYFTYDAILNTRERPTLEAALRQGHHAVELGEVLELGEAGAQILDVRDAAEYAKGHLAGSINIGLGGQYATWAGTVLDTKRPIVIIAEPGREEEAAMRLGRIGFDRVKGHLKDGMGSLANRQDLVWSTERVSAPMLAEELDSSNPPLVVDIRTPREWNQKHLKDSFNVPLSQLQERIAEIPAGRRIAVHCAGGYRSSIAASILSQHGLTNLIELAGGIAAWEAAKFPVVTEEAIVAG
jgi:rhodanese-related sulfurtransferase